jgi:hypothetical protein
LGSQDYPQIREIWLADSQSHDGTLEALYKYQNDDSRVRVIINHKRGPAAGINLALQQATGDIVIRLDAHARYAGDVVRQSVEELLRTGAGGVGAVARPAEARTLTGRAIVAAHNSRFGVGVAKFRRAGAEGWADTVWNGCYWRYIVDRVGPLREDLLRAEDNDFNARVRQLGYGLYLSSKIRATYQPRQTFRALWAQYFANGLGVARALFENPRAISVRHLAPAGIMTGALGALLAASVSPFGAMAAAGLLSLYAGILVAAILLAVRNDPGLHVFLVPAALATLHWSYGCGTLLGLARVLKERARLLRRVRGTKPQLHIGEN